MKAKTINMPCSVLVFLFFNKDVAVGQNLCHIEWLSIHWSFALTESKGTWDHSWWQFIDTVCDRSWKVQRCSVPASSDVGSKQDRSFMRLWLALPTVLSVSLFMWLLWYDVNAAEVVWEWNRMLFLILLFRKWTNQPRYDLTVSSLLNTVPCIKATVYLFFWPASDIPYSMSM